MALGNAVLVASVIVLYRVGCIRSESWVPTSSTEYEHNSLHAMSTLSSSRISESSSHRDVTVNNSYPSRRDMNSRAMHITVSSRLQDPTAHSFYPSRSDWSKEAGERDNNSHIPDTTQEYPGRRDHYPSRRERPQQKIEKIQVRLQEIT